MCTLVLLYNIFDDYPVVALSNRYALRGSLEYPPTVTRGKHIIFSPIDIKSRGTWIGFNDAGLFVAVTDQHTGDVVSWRSRGLLILDVLNLFSSAEDAAKYISREVVKGYKKGNFVVADSHKAFHILYDGNVYVYELSRGVHVFTNLMKTKDIVIPKEVEDSFRRAEMRRLRALELMQSLSPFKSVWDAIEKLKIVASDHVGYPYSICFHGDDKWFMSSSTIVAISKDVTRSIVLYCYGNPCTSKYLDYSHIVSLAQQKEVSASATEVAKKSGVLAGKRIALCVTGSVAAINAPKLVRELRRYGADVTCYMTKAGIKYGVSPEAMKWATGKDVVVELSGEAEHIMDYDLVIVYPATLNTISKAALGVADNAVTSLIASTPPHKLLIAPAMNMKLYSNPFFRENLAKLVSYGATVVEPVISEGAAKAADIETVVDYAIRLLSLSRLRQRNVLILAGPTRYDIDAVRCISSKATGWLGYWLAKEAFWRGCNVKVVYGPGEAKFPSHIDVVKAYSTEDMLKITLSELEKRRYDIVIFEAAILDFKPSKTFDEKIKSGKPITLEFVPTPKVIDEVRKRYPDIFIVSFKLEYKVSKEELIEIARRRLKEIEPGIVVANRLEEISPERHKVYIVYGSEKVKEVDGPKNVVAKEIFDAIEEAF